MEERGERGVCENVQSAHEAWGRLRVDLPLEEEMTTGFRNMETSCTSSSNVSRRKTATGVEREEQHLLVSMPSLARLCATANSLLLLLLQLLLQLPT